MQNNPDPQAVVPCLAAHGYQGSLAYQPASRFWAFQGIETGIFVILAAVLIAELYLGVIVVAFHHGRLLLGLAIVLEACSRMLGTGAAERAGQRGWAFSCAIVGAPVVAWFALLRPSGRLQTEPAPLAGLLAVLAGAVAVVGILIGS